MAPLIIIYVDWSSIVANDLQTHLGKERALHGHGGGFLEQDSVSCVTGTTRRHESTVEIREGQTGCRLAAVIARELTKSEATQCFSDHTSVQRLVFTYKIHIFDIIIKCAAYAGGFH